MMADCPACKAEMSVDYKYARYGPDTDMSKCYCDECGACFAVEGDADWDDGWRDCSTPGKRIA